MAGNEDVKAQDESRIALDGGAYEIIRNRLLTQGNALQSSLGELNQSRKDIFGSIETTILSTERISTQNNCIPRDMVSIGRNLFIFGYNVRMGLKSETGISDVFAVYEYRDGSFREQPVDILDSGRFEADFKDLYKYYKETRFAKFSIIGPHLFMVFNIGKSVVDIKTFKWAMQESGPVYLDNRSDHEFKFPAQHEFAWTRTTRDQHRAGVHPHISLDDRLFVEAVGGDITFKVEDNTADGYGVYSEAVENKDQTLDDAEIYYAFVGNMILVRIRPYQENAFRYYIFNEKTQAVSRVDEIENACVLLPDSQGLMFSNGYYLQTGELKQFESGLADMRFERRAASSNGEDFLYVFYNRETGDHILLHYNIIDQKVDTPIVCSGFSIFDSGEMLLLRSDPEPTKHHVVQIMQTPFITGLLPGADKKDAFLYKVGNKDIVRCMAECNELLRLLNKEDTYSGLYHDIVKKSTDIADAYFWIERPEAFNIKETVLEIKRTASGAIDAFEKVVRLKKGTESRVREVSDRAGEILKSVDLGVMNRIDHFVERLSQLRNIRGEIISLKDLRYVDLDAVESLEAGVKDATGRVSSACVEFLLSDEALKPYVNRVVETRGRIVECDRVADADRIQEDVGAVSGDLEMLIDIVSNLKIEDSTQTTRIIDDISAIYSDINKVKAELKNKRKSLASVEGVERFNARIKLLNQSVINYLDISDTPDKCDEYLTKLMIQLEELEGAFVEFDDFIVQLSEKREALYHAFETRKLSLVEARNKRANALMSAAERILKGVRNRVDGMTDINEINGYFASDLMIEKIRDIIVQLRELDDTVKADDIQSRLKTMREDTVRRLKDRKELFEDGADIIRFGDYRFSVNVQPLDLTIVQRDGEQVFHLAGTDFFETIDHPEFIKTRSVWGMEVPSENEDVYRGEFLALRMLKDAESRGDSAISEFAEASEEELQGMVRRFMGPRYAEGYSKGVHDHDCAKIVQALADIHVKIGLLRFHPRVRALAGLFMLLGFSDEEQAEKSLMLEKLRSFGMISGIFPSRGEQARYIAEISDRIYEFVRRTGLFSVESAPDAATYLFLELSSGAERFSVSKEAFELSEGFAVSLKSGLYLQKFKTAREKLAGSPLSVFEMIRDWMEAYILSLGREELLDYLDEASVLVFDPPEVVQKDMADVDMTRESDGMLGDHRVIQNGRYHLNYYRFMDKTARFESEILPLYNRYQDLKRKLIDEMREGLRLNEFKPRILTSFVRNRLINKVYLPLIGANLAKQIGVAGEGKRTDLMGMLLLISPPGYGKTTLMEYLANRLGVIFMKINGPAIGHTVTSLDPKEASNAAAREEIQKLNLCLEMGDNVMLYLDDIQHLNPEFLQKFISLCDAQRKIEGVYKGKSRTYDLRGKKVVVVMAGNPYTESGEKFKIPDMLANRADTYNLGDIIGDTREDFEMSYLENALTSNPVLGKMSSRSQADVYSIIRIAKTGDREEVEFEGNYSGEEIDEMVSVMKKMITVQEVILKVNKEYIRSAGMADEFRTEPPFKLQGSYRNMNRLTEKLVPIMNDSELKTLLLSHYESEAQTLTTGAEANMLKFLELTGWMTDTQRERWEEIKKTFQKNQMLRGMDESNPVTHVVAQLSAFQDGLESIRGALSAGVDQFMRFYQARGSETREDDREERSSGPVQTMVSFSEETLSRIDRLAKEIKSISVVPVQAAGVDPHYAERIKNSAPIAPSTLRTIHKSRKNDFYLAIKNGNIEQLGELLRSGRDVNARTPEKATPLMAAAVHNNPNVVDFLLDQGAMIDAVDRDGYSALMIAASKGRVDVVKVLLARGANVNLLDNNGMTALMWAEKKGNDGIARLLRGKPN